jgi:hypothetical protein
MTWRITVSALAAAVAGCGAQEADVSKNEGAVAWLAYHRGTIPRACISQLIEKDGTTVDINEKSVRKAKSDAMEIAGSTYVVSRASENLIVAHEKAFELAKEGFAKGYIVERGVWEARTELNNAIFRAGLSRTSLAGLDACEFTATDEAFGFKHRFQVR